MDTNIIRIDEADLIDIQISDENLYITVTDNNYVIALNTIMETEFGRRETMIFMVDENDTIIRSYSYLILDLNDNSRYIINVDSQSRSYYLRTSYKHLSNALTERNLNRNVMPS